MARKKLKANKSKVNRKNIFSIVYFVVGIATVLLSALTIYRHKKFFVILTLLVALTTLVGLIFLVRQDQNILSFAARDRNFSLDPCTKYTTQAQCLKAAYGNCTYKPSISSCKPFDRSVCAKVQGCVYNLKTGVCAGTPIVCFWKGN